MRSPARYSAITSVLTLALVATTGCNVGPKYTRPQVPAPPAFRGADNADVSSDPTLSIGDKKWSEVFREPEL
ncbi:MAG TPA: transporter, partial [Terriglobus sp.]